LEYFWQHKQKGHKNANAVVDLGLRLSGLLEKAAGLGAAVFRIFLWQQL
jgi:hypothetical protein